MTETLLPPLSALTDGPLSVATCMAAVAHPHCGATAVFVGTVRDHDHGRSVRELEYLAHPRAGAELAAVVAQACALSASDPAHPQRTVNAAALHRTGMLVVGDIAVVVATSSAHRADALRACQWLIDELKSRVPIWKRQVFLDGTEEWVGCG